jgi:hypothetical protein
MLKSTRTTPLLSVAVAASGIAAPAAKLWPAVGEVSDTVGAVLPAVTVNEIAVVVVLNTGLPASKQRACVVWLPAATVVTATLYGDVVSVPTMLPSTRNSQRCTLTLSVAVAEKVIDAPAAKLEPAAGLV